MKICRKCGAVLRDSDKYCSQCGARVFGEGKSLWDLKKESREEQKQQKVIKFRSMDEEEESGYRDNFVEGEENSFHALNMTSGILLIMAAVMLAFALYYFFSMNSFEMRGGASNIKVVESPQTERKNAGLTLMAESEAPEEISQPGSETEMEQSPAGAQGAELQSEMGEVLSENTPAVTEAVTESQSEQSTETESPAADLASGMEEGTETEPQTEAETKDQTEKEIETETETETETESESGNPKLPKAADVIDTGHVEGLLAAGSTASQYEIYVYDMEHDSEVQIGDCTQPMYASALITVPILYTAAALADDGIISLDTEIPYVSSIGGRGEFTAQSRDGGSYPLSWYLQTMVHYSDNNCINILIDYLTLDTINNTCSERGFSSVWLERKMVSGNTGGKDNYISAKDLAMMIRQLYEGDFQSVGRDFMTEYFQINAGDSLPTLCGLAPSLSGADLFLNQNGHGDTRYNEAALIETGGARYILVEMLYGKMGFSYSPAVTDISEYISSVLTWVE